MIKGILHRLEALESRRPVRNLLCVLDGRERKMGLLEALRSRAHFVSAPDGNKDFEELYRGILNTDLDNLVEAAEE